MDKPRVKIDNWYLGARSHGQVARIDPYSAPETIAQYIHGDVVGHPRLGDRKNVSASNIVGVDWDKMEVETRNTLYELQAPDPEYLKWVMTNHPEQAAKIKIAF